MSHIRAQVKQYKMEKKALEKKQLKEQKQIEKDKAKEQKQIEKEIAKEKKQLEKDNQNKKKPSIKNTVISQNIQIGEFNENPVIAIAIVEDKCSVILKSGLKKGQQCASSIKQNGLCSRHLSLLQKQEQENKEL
jgi:FKBP-type peptidyl-prolyl cis-trans isomerase